MPEFDYKRHLINSGMNIIGSGTLANAPVASTSNLGTFYLETGDPLWPNGRLYTSRHNGNYVNSGVIAAKDTVSCANSFNPNLDFDLSVYFRQDVADTVVATGLFCQGSASITTRGLWIERDGTTSGYLVRAYYGTMAKSLTVPNLINGKFNLLEVIRTGNAINVYVNSVFIGSIDATGITLNVPVRTSIGSMYINTPERSINGNIAKCSVVCSTGCFAYEFNQASGTTVLDTSGNGNNGTLTDALPTDFWKINWTPVQW